MDSDYKAAFNVLMDYWNCIPEEERSMVDQRLRRALNEDYEPTTADEYNIGVEKGCNSPFKPLSCKIHTKPQDCIKGALKRLQAEFGFGIPD